MSRRRSRLWAIVLLWVYALQFLLGMLLNLFVTMPDVHPGTTGGEYFSRSWTSLWWALSLGGGVALFIHAITGAVLFCGTLALLVYTQIRRVTGWRWPLGLAAFFALAAFFNGMSFLDYGEEFSSAIMATAWLGAVSSISFALIRERNRPRDPAAAHR